MSNVESACNTDVSTISAKRALMPLLVLTRTAGLSAASPPSGASFHSYTRTPLATPWSPSATLRCASAPDRRSPSVTMIGTSSG